MQPDTKDQMPAMALSPTMQEALDYARKNGGGLVRYPGGFWCRDGLMDHSHPWWGTPTVEALVKRGAMAYTEWKETRHSRFPVRAAIAGDRARSLAGCA